MATKGGGIQVKGGVGWPPCLGSDKGVAGGTAPFVRTLADIYMVFQISACFSSDRVAPATGFFRWREEGGEWAGPLARVLTKGSGVAPLH